MAGSQERQHNHNRSRPGSQRQLAPSRTTEAPERSDQQPVSALQDDRRKRNGDRRQGVPLEASARRQGGRGCVDDPLPSDRTTINGASRLYARQAIAQLARSAGHVGVSLTA
jgi:hypothetical protein